MRIFNPVVPLKAGRRAEFETFKIEDAVEQVRRSCGGEICDTLSSKKYDGARLQVHSDGKEVKIFTDGLFDVTERLPNVAKEALTLSPKSFIIDVECETFLGNIHRGREETSGYLNAKTPVDDRPKILNVFDIMYFDGKDLHSEPLADRLDILKKLTFKQSTIGIPDSKKSHFNLAPNFESNSEQELRDVIKKLSVAAFSEGAMCCDPKTPVLGNGINPISSLSVGDKVLTSRGALEKITAVHTRKFKGDLICIQPMYLPLIRLTPEHPVLSINGKCVIGSHKYCHPGCSRVTYLCPKYIVQWKSAKDLCNSDFVLVPKYKTVKITEYLPMVGFHYRANLPEKIPLNDEVLDLIGWYLSEGAANGYTVTFSFNLSKENEIAINVKNLLMKYFNVESSLHVSPERNGIQVVASSKQLSQFFIHYFGSRSWEKKIPTEIMELPVSLISKMIRSYFKGDGHLEKLRLSCCSKSTDLLAQVFLCLTKMDILASWHWRNTCPELHITGKWLDRFGYDHNETNRRNNIIRDDENYFYVPIRSVYKQNYEGLVYNLEIEKDPTFNAGFVVHNCKLADSIYPLTGITKSWVKFKNLVELHVVVWKQHKTRTEGVFNYSVAVGIDRNLTPLERDIIEVKGKKLLNVGKVFNSNKDIPNGTIVTVMIHTLFRYDLPDKKVALRIYEARIYETRPDETTPDSIQSATDIAKKAYVLSIKTELSNKIAFTFSGQLKMGHGKISQLLTSPIAKGLLSTGTSHNIPIRLFHFYYGFITPEDSLSGIDMESDDTVDVKSRLEKEFDAHLVDEAIFLSRAVHIDKNLHSFLTSQASPKITIVFSLEDVLKHFEKQTQFEMESTLKITNKIACMLCEAPKNANVKMGTPRELWSSTYIQAFMNFCSKNSITYSILSRKYGFVMQDQPIANYDFFDNDIDDFSIICKETLKLHSIESIVFYTRFNMDHIQLGKMLKELPCEINFVDNFDEIKDHFVEQKQLSIEAQLLKAFNADETKTHKYVLQSHWRGRSAHWDLRGEIEPGKFLQGYTLLVEPEGAIKDDVETLAEAKRVDSEVKWKFTNDPKSKVQAVKKEAQPCLHFNTPILTSTGFKLAQEVKVGDYTLSCGGEPQTVNQIDTISRTEWVNIKINGVLPITVTPNHPFLVFRGKVCTKINTNPVCNPSRNYFKCQTCCDFPSISTQWIAASELKPKTDYCVVPILPSSGTKSYEEGKFMGWVIGDGNCYYNVKTGGNVQVSLSLDDDADEVKRLMIEFLNNPHVQQTKKGNMILLTSSCAQKAKKLRSLLYDEAGIKRIPYEWLFESLDFKRGLLDGLSAADGSPKYKTLLDTTSYDVAMKVWLLLISLGRFGALSVWTPKGSCAGSSLIRITEGKVLSRVFRYGNYMYIPVKEVILFSQPNMSVNIVANDHTIQVPVITHNSSWLTVEGVIPPGMIGATREKTGVLHILDKGTIEWGAQKSYYQEMWIDGKFLSGHFAFVTIPNPYRQLPPTISFFQKLQDVTPPYVLSRRAVNDGFVPPGGVSALPKEIREEIPLKYRYWLKEKEKDRIEIRDQLFEALKKKEVTLKATTAQKTAKFILQRHWWKGPSPIREESSVEHCDLIICYADGKHSEFMLGSMPSEDKSVSVLERSDLSKGFHTIFESPVSLKPKTKENPTVNTPAWIQTVDSGKVTVIEDGTMFKKFEFDGKSLKGPFILRRTSPESVGEFSSEPLSRAQLKSNDRLTIQMGIRGLKKVDGGWEVQGIALTHGVWNGIYYSPRIVQESVEKIPNTLTDIEHNRKSVGIVRSVDLKGDELTINAFTQNESIPKGIAEGLYNGFSIDAIITQDPARHIATGVLKYDFISYVKYPACSLCVIS